MRDHLSTALDYERKARLETSEFRARCYRQLAALAIEAHATQMALRVRAGSPISAEIDAMIDAMIGARGGREGL